MARPFLRQTLLRAGAVVIAGFAGALLIAGPVAACGGLIGENGTISLVRTTTLAAYHDGIERYVTSFEFTGEGAELGSIVPLPDVPTKVERGGDWTLQRLQQEVAPPAPDTPGIRVRRRRRIRRGDTRDEDRRARHHDPEGWR